MGIVVSEHDPFLGQPIDVRRPAAHHAPVVGADIVDTDVVTPDNQDVWFLTLSRRGLGAAKQQTGCTKANR
jgi:hypothetical protein